MSDISIPGVTSSRFDTDKMIDELMKVERAPLDRMENELETYNDKKTAWRDINRNLSSLSETARSLYSFENPFDERIATSSDESVLTATATREAEEETAKIQVDQVATRDRFLSKSLDTDYRAPAGTYGFTVGNKELKIAFKGGSLRALAGEINDRGRNLIHARVVQNTDTSQVLLIESNEEGADQQLRFSDDTIDFAVDIGMVKRTDDAYRSINPTQSNVRSLTHPINEQHVQFSDEGMLLRPESAALIPVVPDVQEVKDDLVAEITYSVTEIPYEYTPPQPPEGPSTPDPKGIEFEGISITNEPSNVVKPNWEPPEPPEQRDDLSVFFIDTGSGETKLPDIESGDGTYTMKVPVSEYADYVANINVRNNNTHRRVEVHGIEIFDPNARGEHVPLNPIETAGDARLKIDGIEVERGSNEIDDLIPGVTLNLKQTSEKPIDLQVEPDRKSVKESIIQFVGQYNKVLEEINILTGSDEQVVEELSYYTDEKSEAAMQKLGLFQGDITMMQLKSRLQTIMMNPYPTSEGSALTLLDQMGISTNPTRSGGAAVQRSRLRGYLDIDERKLDDAIENELGAVKQLFGNDTDNDMVSDSGVAVESQSYLRPYVKSGGLIATRVSTLDGRISRTNEDIESMQERLARLEQEYRREFAQMEGSMEDLERAREQINNLNVRTNND